MIIRILVLSFTLSIINNCWAGIHFFARDVGGNLGVVLWRQTPILIEINASTSDSLSNAEVIDEVNGALDQWESIPSASVVFQRSTTLISAPNLGGQPDFRNFVSFSSGSFNPGVIALTFVTSDTAEKEIVDADIQFNKGEFRFLSEAQGPSDVNNLRIVLRNVATHEIGHLLGFDHSPLTQNSFDIFPIPESTMFPIFDDRQGTLEQDDISILSFTYPAHGNNHTGIIEGVVLNGDFALDASLGAHVVAWDNLNNPSVAVSTVSGLSSTGVNLSGYYKIEGLPPGNYKVFIEPFPILAERGDAELAQDFDFLNQVTSSFKNSYLFKARTFPVEFWHASSESSFEISTGFLDAEQVFINELPQNQKQRVDFATNQANQDLNLSNSILETDREILYANGTSNTNLRFLPRDALLNPIPTDLSSRLRLTLSTGSFSSSSILTQTTPIFQNDGSFTYVAEIFSTTLPPNVSRVTAFVQVFIDQNSSPIFLSPLQIAFEKADPANTEVLFLPDPDKFDEDAIPQQKRDIFADGLSPATFRIIPKFSNQETIVDPIPLNVELTRLSVDPLEASITTFPVVSIGENQYQTTMTNSLPGVIRPI
ncbi:matrixin family metalloprotease, partial [bacterium]|nr:matrixin family metalloprotease [bacterium]